MKALLLAEPYAARVIEMEKPEPGPGEARIKVLSTGICGSEVLAWHGRHHSRKPPVVTGHEVCGIVDKIGPDSSVQPGLRVAAMPQKSCGQCEWCKAGKTNLCSQRLMLGFPGWQGSFAEYFVIPENLLFPVKDNVADTTATLMEPLAVAIHAVKRAGVKKGDSVIVFGSGAVGLLTILAAQEAGASQIIATDISDFNLELAKSMGATAVHNASQGPIAEKALQLTSGKGVSASIISSEARGLVEDAMNSTAVHGTIIVVASFDYDTPINLQKLKNREQMIGGSLTYDVSDFAEAVEMASKRNDDLQKMVTHVFPLEKGEEAFTVAASASEPHGRVAFCVSEQ